MREIIRSRTSDSATIVAALPRIIDFRTTAPEEQNDLLFSAFNALPQGAALELVSNQDPAPVYRRFKGHFHGAFTWDTLEEGPQTWRARIGKAPGNCCGSCG